MSDDSKEFPFIKKVQEKIEKAQTAAHEYKIAIMEKAAKKIEKEAAAAATKEAKRAAREKIRLVKAQAATAAKFARLQQRNEKRAAKVEAALAKKEADLKRIDLPANMLLLAEEIIEDNNLYIDKEAVSGDKDLQVYSIDASTNLIHPVHDGKLDQLVYKAEPEHTSRTAREVIRFIKIQLADSDTRALDFSKIASVAFLDEPNVTCFKRFGYTRSQAGTITLAQLPGFAHVLSLTSDPVSLTLWIGSLLDHAAGRTQYLHWFGGGGNGKSTVFQAISDALGQERVIHARIEDFRQSHWGVELMGARLLLFPDANQSTSFSTGKFKELTGEDYLTVNPKNKPHRKIRLTHKTAILSNRHPAITNDIADKRRLLPISSREDTETDHGSKSWYADVRNNGERILLYCYSEYQRALAQRPELRAYIPPDESAQAAAIEERYSDVLSAIEAVVEAKPNDPLVPGVKVHDLYRAIGEATGMRIAQREQEAIRDALKLMGIEKRKTTKGRVFAPCSLKRGS